MEDTNLSWRKSSYSDNGGENCVEIGQSWRKSSYSDNGGADCVEVADRDSVIVVRDTKDNGRGQVHTFTAGEWRTFLASVKAVGRLG